MSKKKGSEKSQAKIIKESTCICGTDDWETIKVKDICTTKVKTI